MSLLLRIEHPDGEVYTYTDAEHLEEGGEPTRQVQAGVDAVEVSDLELLIHGTLLGVSDIAELPGEGDVAYRAEVLRDDRGVALNGIIRRRGGITHEPEAARWIVTIEDDAVKAFLDALDFDLAERFGDLQLARTETGVDFFRTVRRNEYMWSWQQWGVVDTVREDPWLSFEGVLVNAVHLTGNVWAGPGADGDTVFEQAIPHGGGTYTHRATVAFTPVMEGTPGWMPALAAHSAKQILDAICVMRGWRVLAAYGEFPDRTITATIVADREGDTAQAVVLDGLLEGATNDGTALTPRTIAAPLLADLAFTYANDPTAETEPVWELELGQDSHGLLVPPEPHLVRAAHRRLRLDADGRPDHDDLVSLPFFLPFQGDLVFGPATEVVAGLTHRPVLAQRLGFLDGGGNGRTGLAIGELVPDPDVSGFYRYLASHVWGNRSASSAVAAGAHLHHYDMSLREAVELEVAVDVRAVSGLRLAVGDPARPVELEGHRWLVMAEEVDLDSGSARLTLRRPVGSLPAMSGEGGSVDAQPAISASFSCAGYNPTTNTGMVITFVWGAPEAAEAGPVHHYERRLYRSPSAGGQGWGPTEATAATSEAITSGAGVHNIMVRAVYGDGGPGAPRSHWGAKGVDARCTPVDAEIGEV